jgi:DeoR family transcriptional regulator of aga operon
LDRIDVLVTDQPVPPAFAADLASAGVELVVAD